MSDLKARSDITPQIVELLEKTLGVDIESPDFDLLESGVLDSLALIEVMTELESAFGVEIPLDALELDDLRTARSLALLVAANSASLASVSASPVGQAFPLPGGGEIRPLDRDRLGEVAALLLMKRQPSQAQLEYFTSVLANYFFDHPHADAEIPSLIAVDADGKLVGFIGSSVRRFEFNGSPVRMSSCGPLIIDPHAPTIGVGLFLLQRYLAGRQDFTISDSATDTVLEMWTKLGGKRADVVRERWTVVLRPLTFANDHFLRGRGAGSRANGAVVLGDRAVAPVARLLLPKRPKLVAESLSPEALRDGIAGLPADFALRPSYGVDLLAWQFEAMAAAGKGEVRSALFRNASGAISGWYVYLLNRGGISHVWQLAGEASELPSVFAHLLHDAYDNGGAVVDGRVEPHLREVVAHRSVKLRPSSSHPLRHTNRADLEDVLFGEAAFLSRSDGESWMGAFGEAVNVIA